MAQAQHFRGGYGSPGRQGHILKGFSASLNHFRIGGGIGKPAAAITEKNFHDSGQPQGRFKSMVLNDTRLKLDQPPDKIGVVFEKCGDGRPG
jgi:hypothetical protein